MQLTEADAWVRHHACAQNHWSKLNRLGVAVSGGSDSLALLYLLTECAAEHGVELEAASVDHGLRPDAAQEAAFVASQCRDLGIPHTVLRWTGWDGAGNLQASARAARYRLLADWANIHVLDAVALGHTLDDQAETFLMRLARESGVDGLAAMDRLFERDGARFWRPLMALERGELQAFLTRHGIGWCDDPSNKDEGFERVRMRKALNVLQDVGIGADVLQGVAINMASASTGLRHCTWQTAERIAHVEAGDVVLDRQALMQAPHEIIRRMVIAGLTWVSGAAYGPRRAAMIGLDIALIARKTHTLHGCLVTTNRDSVRITREFAAVQGKVCPTDQPWDNRWRLTGPHAEGLEIRALGEAVKDCPDWRQTELPRRSLMASPAIWREGALIAAPVAGLGNGWSAKIDHPRGDFITFPLSH